MIYTATDLDGTLLAPTDGDLRSLTSLCAGTALPRPIVIASSRPLADLRRIFGFSVEPIYVVSNDGATCYRMTGERIEFLGATATLDLNALRLFVNADRTRGLPLPLIFGAWEGKETVYYPADPRQQVAALIRLTPDRDYREYSAHNDAQDLRIGAIRAFSFFVKENARDRLTHNARVLAAELGGAKVLSYPDTRLSGTGWVEIVHENLDKVLGLGFLGAAGILGNKYIAFGNAWNDLQMLGKAAFSCVPSDAEPRVLEIASLVSPAPGGAMFCDWLQEHLFAAVKHVLS